MPGTGIKGYTGGSLYGGGYNISNGIIQGGSSGNSISNNVKAVSNSINNLASRVGSAVASAMTNANSNIARNVASGVAKTAGTDTSDYGNMIRDLIAMSQANTAQSQAFAREQMDYQSRSDAAAMAWSANEAQKNRDWQEELSNTAHQREVKDLIAAGLNPILSANNGAYTGSGATGQGFSSSGAMGNVDSTGVAAAGSLLATKMNTASQAMIAKLYTEAEKYQADLNYSASRLNTEASILNNQHSNATSKYIAEQQMANDLVKTRLQGEYGLGEANIHAGATIGSAEIHEAGADRRENLSQQGQNFRQGRELSQRDKELLGAYERTALELMNGNIWTTGAWKGMAVNAEKAGQEIMEFLKDPSGTYDKWRKMEKEGVTRGSVLGYLFGFG